MYFNTVITVTIFASLYKKVFLSIVQPVGSRPLTLRFCETCTN